MTPVALSPQEMPAPLIAQAMYYAAKTNILNPPNLGQSDCSRFVGKPIRFVARLIYAVVIKIVLGTIGFLYHLIAAAVEIIRSGCNKWDAKLKLRAWMHLKAAGEDLSGLVVIPRFPDEPNSVAHWFNFNVVQLSDTAPRDDEINEVNKLIEELYPTAEYPIKPLTSELRKEFANNQCRHDQLIRASMLLRECCGGLIYNVDHPIVFYTVKQMAERGKYGKYTIG